MVRGGMVFCPIIRMIVFARLPVEFELLLTFSVFLPMEAHVHRF